MAPVIPSQVPGICSAGMRPTALQAQLILRFSTWFQHASLADMTESGVLGLILHGAYGLIHEEMQRLSLASGTDRVARKPASMTRRNQPQKHGIPSCTE